MKKVVETPKGSVAVETDVSEMRIRLLKGGKKRPISIRRPSLKKVNTALRRLRNQGRVLRGQLRRTGPLEADRQLDLNSKLERVKAQQTQINGYLGRLTAPKGLEHGLKFLSGRRRRATELSLAS